MYWWEKLDEFYPGVSRYNFSLLTKYGIIMFVGIPKEYPIEQLNPEKIENAMSFYSEDFRKITPLAITDSYIFDLFTTERFHIVPIYYVPGIFNRTPELEKIIKYVLVEERETVKQAIDDWWRKHERL